MIYQVPMGGGEWPLSLVVYEQKEESLSQHHDLARGYPMVNPPRSCYAYVWVENGTPSAVASLSHF
jgi:hypothetical protein